MRPHMTVSAAVDALYMGCVEELWPGKPSSAIAKIETWERLEITQTGFKRDAQADLKVHGGVEKAIHHYAAEHYSNWQTELARQDLIPGGFGENLSTFGLTERTLCIGDILRLGTATVQISQGRQPCWKLNAHTSQENMAYLFQKTGRTGWYYRVLEPGHVVPGDRITLVERPCPEWTVFKVTNARLTHKLDRKEALDLSALSVLNKGWRNAFALIAEGQQSEDTSSRLSGPKNTVDD